jgi:phytoene/squalene synthetase
MLTKTTNNTDFLLYNETCERCAKEITSAYSTSFSLGILALGKSLRAHIRNIYAFVRYADEIVDTFHDYDKSTLLSKFRRDTYEAIESKISYNPVLHAFQRTYHAYNIDIKLVDAFLDSMEMDLNYQNYQQEGYEQYIYGSAEVVGLMCLKVFCEGDQTRYDSLKEPARKLGAAFQKINFLRDLKSDYKDRGRVYFPNVDFYGAFNKHIKDEIEKDIENDFNAALEGIRKLPMSSRFGVYIAYIYFYRLLGKINKLEPKSIMESRIRVNNYEKLLLFFTSYIKFRFNKI